MAKPRKLRPTISNRGRVGGGAKAYGDAVASCLSASLDGQAGNTLTQRSAPWAGERRHSCRRDPKFQLAGWRTGVTASRLAEAEESGGAGDWQLHAALVHCCDGGGVRDRRP